MDDDGTDQLGYRLLLLINSVEFLLCVAQTILHTIFLFIVLTVLLPGDIQLYLQHVNPYILGSTVVFGINVSLYIRVPPIAAS